MANYKQTWNANNRDKVKAYNKRLSEAGYYAEYYRTKLSQPVTCECGHQVCKSNLARHKLTNVHKKIIALKAESNP